jgi:hypothetical protein
VWGRAVHEGNIKGTQVARQAKRVRNGLCFECKALFGICSRRGRCRWCSLRLRWRCMRRRDAVRWDLLSFEGRCSRRMILFAVASTGNSWSGQDGA